MLAFVFPGQGAQKVGMGMALAKSHPTAKQVFDEADAALGFSLSTLCFEGPEASLQLTANSQPAILTASVALLRVLRAETGLVPSLVAGHSLGEYTALVCAGALGLADAVRLVHKRGTFMQEAVPAGQGSMAAIMGLSPADVEQLCRDASEGQLIAPANFNGAGQIVIAGHSDAIERAVKLTKERSATAIPLKVSAPFHCALMAPAAERLSVVLASVDLADCVIPVVSNVTAEPYSKASEARDLLARQVTAPVQWEASVKRLAANGVKTVIEVGPGRALSSLIKRIDRTLTIANCEGPTELPALKERAQGELRAFVVLSSEAPPAGWQAAADGSKIRSDAKVVMWSDGSEESVDETRWRVAANGTKIRRYGTMAVIWPDGKLETFNEQQWEWRQDGGLVRKDRTHLITPDGRRLELSPAEWNIREDGALERKDGLHIIWPDGMEWRPDDPTSLGF